jgi:hypothetical protein
VVSARFSAACSRWCRGRRLARHPRLRLSLNVLELVHRCGDRSSVGGIAKLITGRSRPPTCRDQRHERDRQARPRTRSVGDMTDTSVRGRPAGQHGERVRLATCLIGRWADDGGALVDAQQYRRCRSRASFSAGSLRTRFLRPTSRSVRAALRPRARG